jgi:hypothetical protein
MPDEDQLPPAAVMITHPVADFGTWKAGFDAHEGARRGAGILGHHLNRSQDDPNSVSIYMALSDLDRGKAFASSPDLKSTMEDLGVTGPPDFMWMTPMREAVVWDRELPAMVVTHTVADFDAWLEGYNQPMGFEPPKGSSATPPTGPSTTRLSPSSTTRPKRSRHCVGFLRTPTFRPPCNRPAPRPSPTCPTQPAGGASSTTDRPDTDPHVSRRKTRIAARRTSGRSHRCPRQGYNQSSAKTEGEPWSSVQQHSELGRHCLCRPQRASSTGCKRPLWLE